MPTLVLSSAQFQASSQFISIAEAETVRIDFVNADALTQDATALFDNKSLIGIHLEIGVGEFVYKPDTPDMPTPVAALFDAFNAAKLPGIPTLNNKVANLNTTLSAAIAAGDKTNADAIADVAADLATLLATVTTLSSTVGSNFSTLSALIGAPSKAAVGVPGQPGYTPAAAATGVYLQVEQIVATAVTKLEASIQGAGFSPATGLATLKAIADAIGYTSDSIPPAANSITGRLAAIEAQLATLDTTAPRVQSITLSATGAQNSTLNAGDVITATVTFSEAVGVEGAPTIALGGLTGSQVATYASGAGSDTLVFAYTVQPSDTAESITAAASALSLNGGRIIDLSNNAPISLTALEMPTALPLAIDTTAPTATLTPNVITSAGNAAVSSTEAGTAYLVNTKVNVTSVASITSATDDLWNSVTVTAGNATNLAATGLINGTYKLYTIDAAGNLSAASTGTVTVNTPVFAGALQFVNLTDTGSSDTNTPITNDNHFSLQHVGGSDGDTVVYQRLDSGVWTDLDSSIQTGLADGTYSYRAKVTDAANNTSYTAPISVTVDRAADAAPVITGISEDTGTSDSDEITRDTTPTLTITAAPNSVVQIKRDGDMVGIALETATPGTYEFTSASLSDGTYQFTVQSADAAGNLSAASASYTVVVDTTVSAAADVRLDLAAASDSGTGTGADSDDLTKVSAAQIDVTFDKTKAALGDAIVLKKGATTLGTVTLDADTLDDDQVSFTLAADTLVEGANTLTAEHSDAAGNRVTSATALVVTYDATAPTLSSSTPAANATAVAVSNNIVLTFDEAIAAGTGDIVISNGTDTHTIAVTDTAQVQISGTTVTINPTADLLPGTSYNVQMAPGVLLDTAGNDYAGISSATTLAFTTNASPVITLPPPALFADKVDYTVGGSPTSVSSADVNGDGQPDLLVANSGSDTVSVLTNDGNGSFNAKVDYTVGGTPWSVSSADVNGDGQPDLLVTNFSTNTVSVLTNDGNGSFNPKVDYTVGSLPSSVSSADVNGDGQPDLLVANTGSDTVSVLTNKGNGSFNAKVDYTVGDGPVSVSSADVNGDGQPDLLVANTVSDTVSVLTNNGKGSFNAKVDYTVGSGPTSVSSTDANGDGQPDLLVANANSNTVSVLTNNGSGSFNAKVDYTVGILPTSVSSTDVNGDGKPDLLVTNSDSGTVSVLTNKGDGTFNAKVDYATGYYPYSVTSADVNGDGKADLLVANQSANSVSVLTNTSGFTEQTPVALNSALTLSDADGDADWDGGSLQVQITANASADDVLRLPTSNPGGSGIWLDGTTVKAGTTAIGTASTATASNGAAWTFTFNANATNALVQNFARAIKFDNQSDTPSTDIRTITFTATDKGGASSTATMALGVTAVNDAPTLSGIPDTAETVSTGIAAALADVTVADVDSSTLTVTLTATNGTLGGLTDADLAVEGIQLTGTASAINTALQGASFTATNLGVASIGLRVSDGAASATASYDLTAVAPPDTTPPTATLSLAPTTMVQLEAIGQSNGNEGYPQITAVGSDGAFVVTWFGEDSAGDDSIFVQKFNASGTPTGDMVQLEAIGVTNGSDQFPQITAVGSDGAFVVTWYGDDSEGDFSIFVQKFNASGAPTGDMVQLEAIGKTNGSDQSPQITAVGSDGAFVVTWYGEDSAGDNSIFVQKFNANGTTTSQTPVQLEAMGVSNGYDAYPQITAVGSSGEFVVTWFGTDSAGDFSIFVQKFNASGAPTGDMVQLEAIGKTNGSDQSPQITAVGNDGAFVVTWFGEDSENDFSIFVQKFDASGAPTGDMVRPEAIGVTNQTDYAPQITAVGNEGAFAVTWFGTDSAGDLSIFVQKFNAIGTTTGTMVQLEAIGVTNGSDVFPQITAVGNDGAFVVTWYGEDSENDFSIFVQKFNADGTTTGQTPVQLEAMGVSNGYDADPQITAVGSSGEFVVTWFGTDSAGDYSIFVQKFGANGQPVPGTALINNTGTVTVRSTEVGTAYLVKDSVAVTDLASITGAADAQWNQVAIPTADTDTALAATGLEDGSYKLYTADEAGNLSAAAGGSVRIDSTGPTVTSVTVPADKTYKLGDTLSFTVNTSENVTVTGTPQLALTLGSTTVQATYASGSGGNALVFSYTVASTDLDTDGLAVGTLALNGGTLKDAAGNALTLDLNNVGATTGVKVDGVAPTVTTTSAAYAQASDTLTLTGTDFSTLLEAGEDDSTDIKARLDWSKLVWDINGDDATTANVSFTASDISSAKVSSATTLTVVLTPAMGTALEATTGYGATGNADTLDITAGFARDAAGNAATTDALANGALTITTPPIASAFTATATTVGATSDKNGTLGLYEDGSDEMLPKAGGGTLSTAMTAGNPATITVEAQANVTPALLRVVDAVGNFAEDIQRVALGTAGNDTSLGGTANADFIYGFEGDDTITGGAGADYLDGGAGNDTFIYASSSEFLTGGAVVDSITGGDGTDTIQISGAIAIAAGDSLARVNTVERLVAATVSNVGLNESIVLNSDTAIASIRTIDLSGETHYDSTGVIDLTGVTSAVTGTTLKGVNGGNSNTITGGAGVDSITGGEGADTLNGGAGADVITGGDGADTIDLGASDGATDTVVYTVSGDTLTGLFTNNGSTAGMDVITSAALGDKLQLWDAFSGAVTVGTAFLTTTTGNQAAIVRGSWSGTNFTQGSAGSNDDYIVQWADGTKVHSVVLKDVGTTAPTLTADADADTLTLATAVPPLDTSVVVFDFVNGVSSDHSNRVFNPNVSYTIYVRMDSNSATLNTTPQPGAASGADWGVWSDPHVLGTDDALILVGTGTNILIGQGLAEIGYVYITPGYSISDPDMGPMESPWRLEWTTSDREWVATVFGNGDVSRFYLPIPGQMGNWQYSSIFSTESSVPLDNPNGEQGVTLSQIYLTGMPTGVLENQGLL